MRFIHSGKQKKALIYLFFAVLSVLLTSLLYTRQQTASYKSAITRNFSSLLSQKEKTLSNLFLSLSDAYVTGESQYAKIPVEQCLEYADEGIYFFVYRNSELIFWSDNTVPVDTLIKPGTTEPLQFHTNGFFRVMRDSVKDYQFLGLIKLKDQFAYRNKYLTNAFQQGFAVPSGTEISIAKTPYPVTDNLEKPLFYLDFSHAEMSLSPVLMIALLVSGLLCFLAIIRLPGLVFTTQPALELFSGIVLLTGLMAFLLQERLPAFVFETPLFEPYLYASSKFLPSLGHVLIYSILFIYITYVFFRLSDVRGQAQLACPAFMAKRPISSRVAIAMLVVFLYYVLFLLYELVFQSLIIDSNIAFNLNNIFSIDRYTLTGLTILAVLLFSYVLIGLVIFAHVLKPLSKPVYFSVIMAAALAGYFAAIPADLNPQHVLYPFHFFIFIRFLNRFGQPVVSVSSFLMALVLFSVFNTAFLNRQNTVKEQEKRKLLAVKLSTQRDPTLEYLFRAVAGELSRDSVVIQWLGSQTIPEKKIEEHIQSVYLDDYWLKYDHQVTICRPQDDLLISANNVKINCEEFFGRTLDDQGIATTTENLFFLDDGTGQNNYIGVLPFLIQPDEPLSRVTIFIEFFAKYVPKDLGYPKLLVDEQITADPNELYDYSYARYSRKKLTLQTGKFFYPINQKKTLTDQDYLFYQDEGFDHLLYNIDEKNQLIISKREKGLLDKIAPFSYLFILCSVVFVILAMCTGQIPMTFNRLSFRGRIQLSMISIILVSFVVIGLASYSYILTLNSNKNQDQLGEKAHSVLIEVEHKLSDTEIITPAVNLYMTGLLIKFSNIFFTDINLYDLNGNLIATSRPKIFEEGLLSKKMNTLAFNELSNSKKTQYFHEEKIGHLEYLSTYVPFRNHRNQVIAYLNLPYFAKQGELKNEVSNFITTFINIYLLFIALALIVAILISGYITSPLNLVRQKMGQVSLGKRNEKLDWKRRDEIGALIEEYNRMVDELEASAGQMARSEREGAWREMAKQVAHEIKNPLTPMKLSIQNLDRAWHDKAPDWEERLHRFTATAIDQIDTLSNIASEFSNFAQLPVAVQAAPVDLKEILVKSSDLFKDSSNIDFIHQHEAVAQAIVQADKNQLTRVFNNILKNAVQALEDQNDGVIRIELRETHDNYLIQISDNGPGIAPDQVEMIFSLTFTTKSSGTGLGLAMAKTIVENHQGRIWFESNRDRGTTFFIRLPR